MAGRHSPGRTFPSTIWSPAIDFTVCPIENYSEVLARNQKDS